MNALIKATDSLDLALVQEVQEAASKALAQDGPVAFDLSEVEYLRTSTLQLLISSWREAASRGAAFSLHNVSDDLRQTIADFGATFLLEDTSRG